MSNDDKRNVLKPKMVLGGKYKLERLVGQGEMGVVWKVFDTVGEQLVALKFVPKQRVRNDGASILCCSREVWNIK